MHPHDGRQVWWSRQKVQNHLIRAHRWPADRALRGRLNQLLHEHQAEHDQEGGQ